MATGIVGQPYEYANGNFETAKIGSSFLAEESGSLIEWHTSTFTSSGTGGYRVAIFDDSGTSDGPGVLLGESDEITIDTTDQWWTIPFSTPVAITKDQKYWVLGWSDAASYAVYLCEFDSGIGRHYKDTTGTYPTWEDPAEAENGGTVEMVGLLATGYGVITQTTPAPSYVSTVSIPMSELAASNTATQNTWSQQFHGMQAGDLVVVVMQQRGVATHSIGVTGGQTWSDFAAFNGTGNLTSTRVFYCTFNGTWSASPRFDFSAGVNTTVVISSVKPIATSSTWGVDITQSAGTFTAAATITITGVSPTHANNVTMAVWVTADDNTWTESSGTNWYRNNFPDFRNVAGTDASMTIAHKIQTAAGATGNVARTQASFGNDAGATSIFSFYEIPAAPGGNTTNFFF